MRGTEAVVIRDLRKTFGGLGKKEKVKAVQGVNLDIYPGEITAILGHNGAGNHSPGSSVKFVKKSTKLNLGAKKLNA